MALILLIAALLLFILEGLKIGHPRVSLGWFGMACLAASFLLPLMLK
jgi:hypothetical protein